MEPGKRHTALVISPLNALMDNQVSTWRQRNIKCIALHSNLEAGIAEIKANHYSIVFTSPELVLSAKFRSQLDAQFRKTLCLVALDEAHCITQWGLKSFRPDYSNMAELLAVVPHAPALVMTATTSEQMKRETLALLQTEDSEVIALNPDRPEIFLDVQKPGPNCLDWLIEELRHQKDMTDKTIIYCRSTKQVTNVFEMILGKLTAAIYMPPGTKRADNLLVDMYSASVDESTKTRILKLFSGNNKLRVVVATVAFGMGIDIPDIRNALLWGVPAGHCEYWQQVGRACRDHLPGKSVLYTYPVPSKLPVSSELTAQLSTCSTSCYRSSLLQKLWLSEMGAFPTKGELCNAKCLKCYCQYCTCCSVCKQACPCSNCK